MPPDQLSSHNNSGNQAILGKGIQVNIFAGYTSPPGQPESLVRYAPPTYPLPPVANLIGERQAVVELVRSKLLAGQSIWITGEPGSGKTETGRILARDLQECGYDVWCISDHNEIDLFATITSICFQLGSQDIDFRNVNPIDVLWHTLSQHRRSWCLIVDDWDCDNASSLDATWLRSHNCRNGAILVLSVRDRPQYNYTEFKEVKLDCLSAYSGGNLISNLLPQSFGTSAEAQRLSDLLHGNVGTIVSVASSLVSSKHKIASDKPVPRSLCDYIELLNNIFQDTEIDNQNLPFLATWKGIVALLSDHEQAFIRAFAMFLTMLHNDPVPSSIIFHITDSDSNTFNRELLIKCVSKMSELRLLEINQNERPETVRLSGSLHAAFSLILRSETSAQERLFEVISTLSSWAQKNPAHIPSTWSEWQYLSGRIYSLVEEGLSVELSCDDIKLDLFKLSLNIAEFHYLAGQYELAADTLRMPTFSNIFNDPSSSGFETWFKASLLHARILRECGLKHSAQNEINDLKTLVSNYPWIDYDIQRDLTLTDARTVRELGNPRLALLKIKSVVDINHDSPSSGNSEFSNLTVWALLLNAAYCLRDLDDVDSATKITNHLLQKWDSWCSKDSLHYIDMQFEHSKNLAASHKLHESRRLYFDSVNSAKRLLGSEHLNVLILECHKYSDPLLFPEHYHNQAEINILYDRIADRFGLDFPLLHSLLPCD